MNVDRLRIPAEQIEKGDYLDIGRKSRVHAVMVHASGQVTIGTRVRGSKAPRARGYDRGELVTVWRRATTQETP